MWGEAAFYTDIHDWKKMRQFELFEDLVVVTIGDFMGF